MVDGLLVDAQARGQQLAGAHRAGADLAFLRPGAQQLAGVDARREPRVVDEDALDAQDVGDEVVGEDREPVEVGEARDAGQGEVAGDELRALVEAAVVVHRHAARERLGQPDGGAAGGADEVQRAALAQERPEPAQRLGEEGHELVVGRLPEDVGDLLGAQGAQLGVRPRPVGAEAVGQRPRDGEVARHGRPATSRLRRVGHQPEPKFTVSSVSR